MSASVGKNKNKIIVLNLTSLIDICAILIIFLVMGTVIGQEEVTVPPEFKFPKSLNKEILENAPQVIIFNDEIEFKFLNKKFPINTFRGKDPREAKKISAEVKQYIETIPVKVRGAGILLNLVADRHIPYSIIYDLSKFLRQSGFQSILFVAEGQ